MKSLFNRFVLLTLVLTLLVGCSAPASSPTAAGTSQPAQGDLEYANSVHPGSGNAGRSKRFRGNAERDDARFVCRHRSSDPQV